MVPSTLVGLFWEIDATSLDVVAHRDYVLERVMTRGDLEAMRWLRATYTDVDLVDFLRRRGDRLAPRDRAFWALIAGVAVASTPGGGRPPWAG